MTLFVDASALVAIIRNEPGNEHLQDIMDADADRRTSSLAIWEAARALGREGTIEEGLYEVQRYCEALRIVAVPIDLDEGIAAVTAYTRYGKGHHPARLNMGDCFAYACARTNDARLLYKGDDFSQTDLA